MLRVRFLTTPATTSMVVNGARVIYGAIVVGSILAVESAQHETFAETILATVIALIVYWLAHSYSEYASRRLLSSSPLTLGGLLGAMAHELSIVWGAAVPLLALVVAWVAGASLAGAVNAAIWTSVAFVVAIEIAASLRAEQSLGERIAQAALGAVLGLGVVALKVVLH